MLQVSINWPRLFRYFLLLFMFFILMTSFILILFSARLDNIWDNGISFSFSQLIISFELSLTLFIFITFPTLLFRFMFFFSKMLYRGRKPDVAILNFNTLFNPLNFLFFPSLLNPLGIHYRRRCLITLILLILVYLLMILITN
jgi:hypothetical protein